MHNAEQEMKNAGHNLSQGAANAYEYARTKTHEFGTTAADRVNGATKKVGETMSSLAGTIRASAPQEGTLGSAAKTMADQFDTAGSYLQDKTVEGMTQDLTGLIRRYPLQAVFVGLGLGYLLSRRSER
jgi:hypothetical protein